MLAMNWQKQDVYMRMYLSFFRVLNGGCGYVLKPEAMRTLSSYVGEGFTAGDGSPMGGRGFVPG
jgi:hypothetical protein